MHLSQPYIAPVFVDIGPVAEIRFAVKYAQAAPFPAKITGPAGSGKTTALHYLAQEYHGTYCAMGQAHKTAADLYRMLLTVFEIYHDCRYNRDLFSHLVDGLNERWQPDERKRKLLIVDEVQTLSPMLLRELLNIQETCNLALVLSGNSERLAGGKAGRDAWEQIDSRIGMRVSVPNLTPNDCVQIAAAYGVEGMDAYSEIERIGTQSSIRRLAQILDSARMLTSEIEGAAIRLPHIQHALAAMNYKQSFTVKQSKGMMKISA